MNSKRIKVLYAVICLLFLATMSAGCKQKEKIFNDLSDLNDSKVSIGMWSGVSQEEATRKYFPKAKPVIAVDSIPMTMASLRINKFDAVLTQKVFYDALPDKSGLKILGKELEDARYGFFFAKNEKGKKLRDQMNEFIVKANKSGLRKQLEDIWLGENPKGRPIGKGSDDPDAEELVYGIEYETIPFGYVENKTCIGFDADYAECFCREYGYRLKIVGLPYSMIAIGDESGEYDFAGGGLMLEDILYETKVVSQPHLHSPFVVVIKDPLAEITSNFSLKDSLKRTFIEDNRWEMYLEGLLNTILITLASAFMGTILGVIVYVIAINTGKWFKNIVKIIFTILHITPVVVLLLIFYHIIFSSVEINSLAVSIILFTLIMCGTVYDLTIVSVDTIDKGQCEAAIALGYTPLQAYLKVIMPQALRHFIPLYKNVLVDLIMGTAIVGYIAVPDLSKVADIIRTRTFDAFVPLFSAAVIYIILALMLIWLVNLIYRKTDPRKSK